MSVTTPDALRSGQQVTMPVRMLARAAPAILQAGVLLAAIGCLLLAVVPALLGYKGEVVLSGSMQPMLHVGDVAYSQAAAPEALRVGQVVTFHAPVMGGALVTHRIIAINGHGAGAVLTTKGDNNPVPDSFTTPVREVIGQHAFTVPKLGKALALLRNRTSYVRLAGLLFLLVVLHERRSLLIEFRGRRTAAA